MTEQSKHPILVVDDEPEILQSLRGLLRLEFEVHTAHNGFEAPWRAARSVSGGRCGLLPPSRRAR